MIETQYNGVSQSLGVSSPGPEQIYFVAPGNSWSPLGYIQAKTIFLQNGSDHCSNSFLFISRKDQLNDLLKSSFKQFCNLTESLK